MHKALEAAVKAIKGTYRGLRGDDDHHLTYNEDAESLGPDTSILYFDYIGLWIGYGPEFEVKKKTIVSRTPIVVPGFAVGFTKTVRNYPQAPDEQEDVESLRTTSLREAVVHFFSLYVGHHYDNWSMSDEG